MREALASRVTRIRKTYLFLIISISSEFETSNSTQSQAITRKWQSDFINNVPGTQIIHDSSIVRSSFPLHITLPPFGRVDQNGVVVESRQQIELVHVGSVVVPPGNVGAGSQRKMPEVVEATATCKEETKNIYWHDFRYE